MPDLTYDQRLAWILRQNRIGPFQLKEQYAAYKDKRAAFEAGYGTADEMAVLITPGVAAMLDLEDQMLADFTAVQSTVTEETPSRRLWSMDDSMYYFTIVCCVATLLVATVVWVIDVV
jgi:hypothetical protein